MNSHPPCAGRQESACVASIPGMSGVVGRSGVEGWKTYPPHGVVGRDNDEATSTTTAVEGRRGSATVCCFSPGSCPRCHVCGVVVPPEQVIADVSESVAMWQRKHPNSLPLADPLP